MGDSRKNSTRPPATGLPVLASFTVAMNSTACPGPAVRSEDWRTVSVGICAVRELAMIAVRATARLVVALGTARSSRNSTRKVEFLPRRFDLDRSRRRAKSNIIPLVGSSDSKRTADDSRTVERRRAVWTGRRVRAGVGQPFQPAIGLESPTYSMHSVAVALGRNDRAAQGHDDPASLVMIGTGANLSRRFTRKMEPPILVRAGRQDSRARYPRFDATRPGTGGEKSGSRPR